MSLNTIVEYFPEHEGHKCGYCGSPNSNFSHGMWAHSMAVQDYQDLIDRGWRRSGQYCYKPTMDMTCCPHYTIRCDVTAFRLSKSHKKVLKLVNRFLNHDVKPKPSQEKNCGENIHAATEMHETFVAPSGEASLSVEPPCDQVGKSLNKPTVSDSSKPASGTPSAELGSVSSSTATPSTKNCQNGKGADPLLPACRKKKEMRRERYLQKHGQLRPKTNTPVKSLEDFLEDRVEKPAHKLELQLVASSPASAVFTERFEQSHSVYRRYQMSIHHDPESKPNEKQYTRFLVKSPLKVKSVVVDNLEPGVYQESYSIYKSYQMRVHGDPPEECDENGFSRFLIQTSLVRKEGSHPGFPGYGAFHQHYILDGKIIAVGVIDILPNCVSSKYFYYDPDYAFLSLGTYSALREIAFIRDLQKMQENLKYYYMGFYIHSCPKMKYKGQYYPSFLLCPESYAWVPIEKCTRKLDANKYSRLAEDPDLEDPNKNIILDQVCVLFLRQMMDYQMYKSLCDAADEDVVLQYAGLVGKPCAKRMLLYRSGDS